MVGNPYTNNGLEIVVDEEMILAIHYLSPFCGLSLLF